MAAQQFFREFGDRFKFDLTQVIGLTNDYEVSKEYQVLNKVDILEGADNMPGKW